MKVLHKNGKIIETTPQVYRALRALGLAGPIEKPAKVVDNTEKQEETKPKPIRRKRQTKQKEG